MEMANRTGQAVGLTLIGKDGARREICKEDMDAVVVHSCQVKKELGRLAIITVKSAQIGIPLNLALMAAKKAMGKNYAAEHESISKMFAKSEHPDSHRRLEEFRNFGLAGAEIAYCGRNLSVAPIKAMDLLGLFYEVFYTNEYDLSEKNVRGREIVDAGANVGLFSMACAALGAKKIHAFEPVSGTFGMLEANVRANGLEGAILPVRLGLGQENFKAKISFNGSGDACASIVMNNAASEHEEIEIVRLDDYLKGGKIGFLKIDTEGYEEQVLLGGAETIRACKPELSFSAYHKPTDKARLPEVLRSIRADYDIKLNITPSENFHCV